MIIWQFRESIYWFYWSIMAFGKASWELLKHQGKSLKHHGTMMLWCFGGNPAMIWKCAGDFFKVLLKLKIGIVRSSETTENVGRTSSLPLQQFGTPLDKRHWQLGIKNQRSSARFVTENFRLINFQCDISPSEHGLNWKQEREFLDFKNKWASQNSLSMIIYSQHADKRSKLFFWLEFSSSICHRIKKLPDSFQELAGWLNLPDSPLQPDKLHNQIILQMLPEI